MSRNFLLFLLLMPWAAHTKPIAFQDGYTVMTEYGAGTMSEVQGFYAPRFWYSVGAGHLRLDAHDDAFSRDITYTRLNYLVKRWNLPAAQGNIFVYGGLGAATGSDFSGSVFAGNAGAQADYETRRFYGSIKTDFQGSEAFTHRIDTLQLGVAPYAHDYGDVATWLVAQTRLYSGGIYPGLETAALLRLFKAYRWGSVWFEGGGTLDGKLQSMLMFNF